MAGSKIMPKWSVADDSAVNTAKTITKDAEADKRHYITGVDVFISAAAAANDITVELRDGATKKWKGIIGSGAARGTRIGFVDQDGIMLSTNTAANLVVDAGGAGVVTHLNMIGYTRKLSE